VCAVIRGLRPTRSFVIELAGYRRSNSIGGARQSGGDRSRLVSDLTACHQEDFGLVVVWKRAHDRGERFGIPADFPLKLGCCSTPSPPLSDQSFKLVA
jgi:hypothetical protein